MDLFVLGVLSAVHSPTEYDIAPYSKCVIQILSTVGPQFSLIFVGEEKK